MNNCPEIQGGNFPQIFVENNWNLFTKNVNCMTDTVEILQRGQTNPALQDFKTTVCQWPRFMVQISCKYFHSQEARDHIIFNLSQTFKTQPSIFLLKLLSCLCLYSTHPQLYIKSESKIQIFWSETIVENCGGEAWDGDIPIVHWQKEIALRCYWIKIRNSLNKSTSVA